MRRLHINRIARRLRGMYSQMSYRRKCRLYCVGGPKTGTTSIASMFMPSVRAAHEPTAREIVERFIDSPTPSTYDPNLATWVIERDKSLCLDVDASQLNVYLVDYLLKEFRDARFLLTMRDPFSWLKSLSDHVQRTPSMPEHWVRYRDYRFRPDIYPHPKQEAILKENGLYSLDGYLSYWSVHNRRVLEAIPDEKLMIVKTNEIESRASDIARFAGLSGEMVVSKRLHKNKNTTRNSLMDRIPEGYIEKKVEVHCGELMAKYFPEITSFEDSVR